MFAYSQRQPSKLHDAEHCFSPVFVHPDDSGLRITISVLANHQMMGSGIKVSHLTKLR